MSAIAALAADAATEETLPILDFGRFDAGPDERATFLRELRETARRLGFFYLTGHGISQALIDEVLAVSRRFFALPEADKLSIEMIRSPHFRGYNRAGYEHTRGKPDWREQIDFGGEVEAAPFDRSAPVWTRLEGPNLWPAALPALRPAILAYQDAAADLAVRLLQAFSVALGQTEDAFAPIYTPAPHKRMKIIRYPGRTADRTDQGVGAHKDSGFLTILLQDRVAGLEVEGERGWIAAPPLAGTVVVNIGEILELASNGYLRANVHRVVSPPEGAERLSVAAFIGGRLDATVPVLDLPEALRGEVRGVTQDPDNPLFHDVGKNYLKSRLRSHPDVAQRYHADLLDPTAATPTIAAAY